MMAGNAAIGTTTPKQHNNSSLCSDYFDLPGDPLTVTRAVATPRSTLDSQSETNPATPSPSNVSVVTTTSEPLAGEVEDSDDKQNSSFHHTLSRHLSHLAMHTRHREGIDGDVEESHKKRRLLLGKMFGNTSSTL